MSYRSKKKGFGFGGFALQSSFHKAGELGSWQQGRKEEGWSGKKHRSEDDYFEGSDSDSGGEGGGMEGESEEAVRRRIAAEYQNEGLWSTTSSGKDNEQGGGGGGVAAEGDDDDDPLDAFMAGIESQIKKQKDEGETTKKEKQAMRYDIEQEDDHESYFKAMANAPILVADGDEEIEVDYDSDGFPIPSESAKVIDPLPPIDHSAIDYPSFNRNFYEEHPEITALSKQEVIELKKKLGIKVSGYSPPKPCVAFAHFGFDDELVALIRKSEFSQPTPIQSQAIPVALSGRDIIGIAKTGSGKTAAFLWPLLVHAIDQPELKEEDGPIGLICAPTRELCQQIYHEARKFGKAYNLTVTCVYGGGSKWEQSKAVKEGCEILVATPGRLIDLVKIKATNLQRVTYLVFDEADRMFDMGFEAQVRSIANHVRPDRQTLLFSATFRKKIERLCRDVLTDPIRIVIGDLGEANTDITQIAEVMKDEQEKWRWLLRHLVEFTSMGSVLIFVTRKVNSEEVATSLRGEGHQVGLLHGDMSQGDRDKVITTFKKKEFPILVATDIAARGLDIPSIKTVINFDVAKSIDTHVHRIGRTGRAGEKGTAFTLVTPKDVQFAGQLVRNLEMADQRVPDELMQIAVQNAHFRRSRQNQKSKGRGRQGGGGGGGGARGRGSGGTGGGGGGRAKLRPGLGATAETMATVSSKAVGPMGSLTGPGANRASVLRAAYQQQYKMKFTQASSSTLASTSSLGQPQAPAPHTAQSHDHQHHAPSGEAAPPPKKKRKSRWD